MSPNEKKPNKTKPAKTKNVAAKKIRPTKKELKAATKKALKQYGVAIKDLAKR